MSKFGRITLVACFAALGAEASSTAALAQNYSVARPTPNRVTPTRRMPPAIIKIPVPPVKIVRPTKPPKDVKEVPPQPAAQPQPTPPPRRTAEPPPPRRVPVALVPPSRSPEARPDFFPEEQGDHPLALFLAGAYQPNIVLVAVPAGAPVDGVANDNDLTVEDQLSAGLLPFDLYRLRLGNGQQVHEVVDALGANQGVITATPNFIYTAQGQVKAASSMQFAPQRMHVTEAHKIATGNAVKVAIIDTGIDDHSELAGSVIQRYDAVDAAADASYRHGTAMAGVIASKNQLLGIAPNVSILSAQAFAPPKSGSSASGTTFAIIKSMDWAYKAGARVYNLSFAGPKDPVLIRALDALADYNTIMIGAAGNAGPGKPPAYPAAHKGVIAVTATDQNDGLYTMANRGAYVAVAAPGVDILTTTPGEGYEFMSGTSIATAHITGVVALVLERHPDLKADAMAQLLANASIDLGERGFDTEFGAGLVDAMKALESGNALADISTGGLTARK